MKIVTFACTQNVVAFKILKLGVVELLGTLSLTGLRLVGSLATGLSLGYSHFIHSAWGLASRETLLRPPFCHLMDSVCYLHSPASLNTFSDPNLTPSILSSSSRV